MSDIRIEGLSKRYGRKVWALRDVTLSIRSGEILALVGASGCGKSTLLRCIAGFEEPSVGRLLLDDATVCGDGRWVAAEHRRVGVVFQEHALFPHLRVDANVSFGLRDGSRAERRAMADEQLAHVGLPGLGRRYPHELSGGQRRRVALARALAPRPRVVLLDEPLSGLDEPLRDALRDQVHEALREAGSTAVWVTHRASDALAVADRIAVLRDGQLEQLGEPRDVYEAPVSVYTARLFGAVNVLEGTTRDGETRTPLGTFDLDAAPGPALIGVRPEHLWLRAPAGAADAAGEDGSGRGVPARVEARTFRGAEHSARVVLNDGTRLEVRLAPTESIPAEVEVEVGARRDVPRAVHVFRKGASR